MSSGLETIAVFAQAAPGADVGVAVLALDRHQPADIAAKLVEVGVDTTRLLARDRRRVHQASARRRARGLAAMRAALPRRPAGSVAAMGPKMCALAGAEADGAFLNWMTPGEGAWARERIHEGAPEAGRPEPPPVFGYVRVAVGEMPRRACSRRSPSTASSTRDTSATSTPSTSPGDRRHRRARSGRGPTRQLNAYEGIDHIVGAGARSADADSLIAVAEAAAP